MKLINKIICISLILMFLVNCILPRVSFATDFDWDNLSLETMDQLTPDQLAETVEDGFNEKIIQKIILDRENENDNYSQTTQFLLEYNEHMKRFREIVDKFNYENLLTKDNNLIAEEITELRDVINGLYNYYDESYVDFISKNVEAILAAELNDQGIYIRNMEKILVFCTTGEVLLSNYVYDDEVEIEEIKKLEDTIGNEYVELNKQEQIDAIFKEIKQKIAFKIESLTGTEEDEEELIKYIEELMESIDQENVSEEVKNGVKEKMKQTFYNEDGNIDIKKTQNELNVFFSLQQYETVYDSSDDLKYLGIALGGLLDTVLGIFTYPFKLVFVVPGLVCNLILTEIASVGSGKAQIVTLEDILFNKLSLTDINVFSNKTAVAGLNVSETIQKIRGLVAGWYVAFRNLAIVTSLAVLIYVGIRMALDSFAERKARYKQMLVNWVIGLGLTFLLHFIIILVINSNSLLVESLANANNQMLTSGTDAMTELFGMAFDVSFVKSWGAAIMYSILLVITLVFLIIYIKRMLMVCFLVMIAPIVSITYGIDRINSNKSEMLNSWLKEFCYNVLIQPFHCIAYIVFVGNAMNIMYNNMKGFPIGAMVLAIVYIVCVFMGEKLVRTIFGFGKSKSKNIMQRIFRGSMVTKAISDIKTIKQSQEQMHEEEEEPPMFTPDGEETEEVMKAPKVKYIDETKKENSTNNKDERNNSKDNNTNPIRPETKEHKLKRKLDEKVPMIVKDAGRAYTNGLKTVTGYNAIQKMQDKSEKIKKIPIEEQFLKVSKQYQEKLNLTDKQLALRMEAISKTPMKEIESSTDIIYKQWLEYLQKGFKQKGYSNPQKVMEDLIMKNDKKGKNVSNNS